jgi:hypothetical protein
MFALSKDFFLARLKEEKYFCYSSSTSISIKWEGSGKPFQMLRYDSATFLGSSYVKSWKEFHIASL